MQQENAPNLHGREPPKEESSLFPGALRERGVWGERGFSQRSRLSPQRSPYPRLFGREREGGGFSSEKPPPSQSLYYFVFLVGSLLRRVASGWAACFMKAEGLMPTMFLNCLLK